MQPLANIADCKLFNVTLVTARSYSRLVIRDSDRMINKPWPAVWSVSRLRGSQPELLAP